jgi:hypothetical protein
MRLASTLAVLASALLASCSGSGSGGTSATAKRLVGHWSTPSDDHEYFGETDRASSIGSYILVHPDGKSFTHRYQVESADDGDRTLKINLLFASGDSREETLVVSDDGKSIEKTTVITGIEVRSQLNRVDDKTAL